MCSPAPPPTLATALLHSQVLWFGFFLVLLILWPCLTDGFYLLRGGRSRTRTMVLVLSAIGYGAAFTSIAFATMDLAWQDAVMAWDGAQIDALERHDCAIAILAAVVNARLSSVIRLQSLPTQCIPLYSSPSSRLPCGVSHLSPGVGTSPTRSQLGPSSMNQTSY